MDDILTYESSGERDDCVSPVFGYSTGSSDTSVGCFYKKREVEHFTTKELTGYVIFVVTE